MKIEVSFSNDQNRTKLNFKNFQQITSSEVEKYEGDYTVTPKTDYQILKTKDKYMADNVTVKEIPYYEVSNGSGSTVYIGKEIVVDGN